MTSKIISLREDIYNNLKMLKDANESFSDVIERLISHRKKDPIKHAGILNDLPENVVDDFENIILEMRNEDAEREAKREIEE